MFRFAICDDEALMTREISNYLASYMEENQLADYRVSLFSNSRSLLESGGVYDVIFLDIRMERPDGMETAKILRQRGNYGILVFVTALKEYVFDAFEVEACGYLLKPLDGTRFRRTMDRAFKQLGQRAGKNFIIQRGTAREVISLSEIIYCEVQGRKIYIHKNDGTVIDYYDKLEDLERRVDKRFFRCHRSYLVNLDFVRGRRPGQVILPRDEVIPASRLRERELIQTLLRHMKERDF